MAESASGEVEVVLKNYLDALSEKDDDIVKLYEDNYRLRAVAEAAVKAKNDLETRYRTTALLAASLQTELQEKAALIAAQQDEAGVLRETMADLANLLGLSPTTWPLEGGPGDVVASVARLRQAHELLDVQVPQLQHDNAVLLLSCLRGYSESEAHARRALCEVSELFWQASHHAAALLHDLAEELSKARAETHAARQEAHDTAEQLGLAVRHAELEAARLRREEAAAAASVKDELVARQVEQLARQGAAHDEELRLFVSSTGGVIDTLRERAIAAETSWAETAIELCGASARAVAQAHTQCATQLQVVQAAHTDEQARLRRLLVEATGAQQRLRAQAVKRRADYVTLEGRYRALVEKSRRRRRLQSSAARQLTAQLAAQQSATQAADKRAGSMEMQLRAAQQQIAAYKRQLAALERTVAAAEARNVTLVDAAEQTRLGELRMCSDLQSQQRALQQRGEAGQRDARSALVANEAAVRVAHEEHEQGMRAQLMAFARDQLRRSQDGRIALQREVQAWAELAESLKDQLAVARRALSREQAARRVLEAQQSEETRLLRQLVTTPSSSQQTSTMLSRSAMSEEGAVGAVQTEECAWLRSRARDLEQACRKSASVIAELREALHRERASALSSHNEQESRIVSSMQ